jgi:hypothetical protein
MKSYYHLVRQWG